MDVSLRRYADADFDKVTSIWLESWESTGVAAPVTLRDLRKRWPNELAKGWKVHVATVGPEVVGFLAFYEDKLEQLFIAPSHQCQGIGKRLLDLAKAQMPGGFHLTTALQSRARRFYEREGMQPGETTLHPRFGHQEMYYEWRP